MSKELTPKQLSCVELLTSDGLTVTEIAKLWDCSASNVYRMLSHDHVRAEVIKRSRAALVNHAPVAAATVARLSRSAKSEYVQLEASKALLDRAGVTEAVDNAQVLAIQINLGD